MSMEDQIKKITAAKEKQIAALTKMKDVLKNKLMETKKENTELKKRMDEMQKQLESQAKVQPQAQLNVKLKEELEFQKKKLAEIHAELKGLPTQPPVTQENDFDPSIIDKKINAMNAKMDKKFDAILDVVNRIFGKMNEQPKPQKENMVNSFKDQIMNQQKGASTPSTESAPAKNVNTGFPKPSQRFKSEQQKIQQEKAAQQEAEEAQQVMSSSGFNRQQGFQRNAPTNQPAPRMKVQINPELLQKQMQQGSQQPQDTEEQEEVPPEEVKRGLLTIQYPSNGVIKCPHCGKQNFKEMENRAQIISYVPRPKYGTKYYCKVCRGEWAYKY